MTASMMQSRLWILTLATWSRGGVDQVFTKAVVAVVALAVVVVVVVRTVPKVPILGKIYQ